MLDLAWWARVRKDCGELCERITEKAGRDDPVAKASGNGHDGHRPALGRALATGAARRREWR